MTTLEAGRLVLAVSKDTYELLGLPGRASMHGSLRQRFSTSNFPLRIPLLQDEISSLP